MSALPVCNDWDSKEKTVQVYKPGPNPGLMWGGLSMFIVFFLVAFCAWQIMYSTTGAGLSGLLALVGLGLFILAFVTAPEATKACTLNPILK